MQMRLLGGIMLARVKKTRQRLAVLTQMGITELARVGYYRCYSLSY